MAKTGKNSQVQLLPIEIEEQRAEGENQINRNKEVSPALREGFNNMKIT